MHANIDKNNNDDVIHEEVTVEDEASEGRSPDKERQDT
jgi:hypothetical protein